MSSSANGSPSRRRAVPPVARNASLRLRGLHVPIVWPAAPPAGLLVLLGAEPSRELAERHGVVILCAAPDDGATVIAWAADHAAELGVTGPLLLAGEGAEALARRARDEGWPDVALARDTHR